MFEAKVSSYLEGKTLVAVSEQDENNDWGA
jgi:hypothetical protein